LSVGRKALGQDPINGILLPTDENIGSRMKTCLSIIDSYDELIMDFIFPPNLSFFVMNFELVLGTCFKGPSLVRLRRLEQMVGKDGWNEWKSWSKSKIVIHRIYLK
jgi:hypothetical protein